MNVTGWLVSALPRFPAVGPNAAPVTYAVSPLAVEPNAAVLPVDFDFSEAMNGPGGEYITSFQVNAAAPLAAPILLAGATRVRQYIDTASVRSGISYPIACSIGTAFTQSRRAQVSLQFIPPHVLTLQVISAAPNIPASIPKGSVVAELIGIWGDGVPFMGNFTFAAPNFSAGGIFAITQSAPGAVGYLIINPSGPGVGPGASIQNVTVVANDPPV